MKTKFIAICILLHSCVACAQDINIYKNYRFNHRVLNTTIIIHANSQQFNNYTNSNWFNQYAAENPLDPVAYSYESNKLLNMPQNVTLTNPPSTADQIKENILRYRRTKNF